MTLRFEFFIIYVELVGGRFALDVRLRRKHLRHALVGLISVFIW